MSKVEQVLKNRQAAIAIEVMSSDRADGNHHERITRDYDLVNEALSEYKALIAERDDLKAQLDRAVEIIKDFKGCQISNHSHDSRKFYAVWDSADKFLEKR